MPVFIGTHISHSGFSSLCLHSLTHMNEHIKYFLSFIIVYFMMFDVLSQNNSYTNSNYNTLQPDSTYIFLDSAKRYTESHSTLAAELITKGLESAIVHRNRNGEAQSYLDLAEVQRKLGRYNQAIENVSKCKTLFHQRVQSSNYNNTLPPPSSNLHFDALALSAQLYEETNNLTEALSESNQALQLLETASSAQKKNNALRDNGRLLSKNGKHTEALNRLNTLLDTEKKTADKSGQCETLLSLGDHYTLIGDNNSARSYYQEAISIANKEHFTEKNTRANSKIASIFQNEGDFTNEILYLNNAANAIPESQDDASFFRNNIAIGNAYIRADNLEDASEYLDNSVDHIVSLSATSAFDGNTASNTISTIRSTDLQIGADAYRQLAEGYLKNNELEKSIKYYKKYSVLQDSVKAVHEREMASAIELSNNLGKNEQRLDLLLKEQELADQSIFLLQQDQQLKSGQIFNRNLAIGVLLFCLLGLFAGGLVIYRNNQARRRADKLLALQSMSGQMNPHFIFNALNSVNEYISQNDERAANRYLSSFSKLMRQVMDDSKHPFIPLTEEISMLRLYLELEHARFKDQFEYTFIVDQELENSDYELPPMMVQPFIENSIWHGLRYRSGKGALEVNFKKVGENIEITISDNGIGMTKSKELKTQHQKKQNSLGMKNIHTRLALMNEIYNAGMTVEISETFAGAENPGATVKIRIPQLKLSENSKTR